MRYLPHTNTDIDKVQQDLTLGAPKIHRYPPGTIYRYLDLPSTQGIQTHNTHIHNTTPPAQTLLCHEESSSPVSAITERRDMGLYEVPLFVDNLITFNDVGKQCVELYKTLFNDTMISDSKHTGEGTTTVHHKQNSIHLHTTRL